MSMSPAFRLTILSGPRAGEQIPVTEAGITIGRLPDNTLALDDGQLSRHHARVDLRAGQLTVTDLGSANGTRVNGGPVAGTRPLGANDTIALGTTQLRVEQLGGGQPAAWGGAAPDATVAAIPPLPAPPPAYNAAPPPAFQQGTPPAYGQAPPTYGQGAPTYAPAPSYAPAPPPAAPARGKSRLPLIIGGVVGALLLCVVAAVAIALIVANRGDSGTTAGGGTPTGGGGAGARAGTISGRVTDEAGKPIPNGVATIVIRPVAPAGGANDTRVKSDAEGKYSQQMPDGQYRVTGTLELTIEGKKWTFDLYPTDGDNARGYESKGGVVKDFQWKMSGKKPGTTDQDDPTLNVPNYYGGAASFAYYPFNQQAAFVQKSQGAKIELTLTPRGNLLDGTPGKPVTLQREVPRQLSGRAAVVPDIPLGAYTVTAQVVEANGTRRPLRVGAVSGTAAPTLGPSANLDFTPAGSVGTAIAEIVMGE